MSDDYGAERRDQTPTDPGGASKSDPIDAELERALFKRFWIWLGIVGSVAVVATSAISVLAAWSLASASERAALHALDRLSNKISETEFRAVVLLGQMAADQKETSAAAKRAAEQTKIVDQELEKLRIRIDSQSIASAGNLDVGSLAQELTRKGDLTRLVAEHISGQVNKTEKELNDFRIQMLSKIEARTGRLSYGTPPVECPRGYVVIGVQIGGENFTLRCGQLLPLDAR